MSDLTCPHCKGLKLNNWHRCPPMWVVQYEDEDEDWRSLIRPVYATDANEAAEKWANHSDYFSDTGDNEMTVWVADYPDLKAKHKILVMAELVRDLTTRTLETAAIPPEPEESEGDE